MLDYVIQDRAALEAQVTAKGAEYGADWLLLGDAHTDEEPSVVAKILSLMMVATELRKIQNPGFESKEYARANVFVDNLVEVHGLGALPVPPGVLPIVSVSGGGGSVTWDTLPGKPTNLAYLPGNAAMFPWLGPYIQTFVDGASTGVTDHAALTGLERITKPGETAVGFKHLSNQVANDLLTLLYPYVQPTATLTVSPSGLQERGSMVTFTVDGGFTVGSDSAPTQGVYKKDGTPFLTQTTGIGAATTSSATDTVSYSFSATFPGSGVKTFTVGVTFAVPTFNGVAAPGAVDSQILALAKQISQHGTSLTLNFPAGAIGQVYQLAFLDSWGMPTMVKDSNGFNITSAWNIASGSHTGNYTNGNYTGLYRFIKLNNAFAASIPAQSLTFFWA